MLTLTNYNEEQRKEALTKLLNVIRDEEARTEITKSLTHERINNILAFLMLSDDTIKSLGYNDNPEEEEQQPQPPAAAARAQQRGRGGAGRGAGRGPGRPAGGGRGRGRAGRGQNAPPAQDADSDAGDDDSTITTVQIEFIPLRSGHQDIVRYL